MEESTMIPGFGGGGLETRGTRPEAAARLFGDWLAALSKLTRLGYGKDLQAFAAFLKVPTSIEAVQLLCARPPTEARDLALRFKTALRDAGAAPASVNRKLSTLRSVYRHVRGANLVVPSMRAERRRKILRGNCSIISLLLSAAKGEGLKGTRDRALLLVLHDSGLRRSEAATLRCCDLDLGGRVAHVLGKGHQERVPVDLSTPAVEALRGYLEVRGAVAPNASLFVNVDRSGKGSGKLTADGIRSILKALSLEAGLSQPVAPHDLRRQGAHALARVGTDVEGLRMWGRWSDYRMPARYVGEVAEKARQAVDVLAGLRRGAK